VSSEDRPSTGDALLGRTIAGKYTIESRVGGGGMGSVYRARQAGLDKIVAVKVLHRELMAEPTFATRFKREATSASRIDHKSSLRVLDFGEEPDGLLYIAMEFLEGKTLFKILREEAPLAPGRIVDLARQVLAALAAAHDLGIVHRDLKPENVVILPGKDDDGSPTELVKVCDFGIAKLQSRGEVDEKLTLEGSIVGTPEYLSPEQARGGELDARSDLYSMGVILFEMLTGEPPFRGDSPLAIVLKHLDAPPPRPSSITPAVDPKLEAVCLKALSKSPADRYASAREMRAALQTDTPHAAAPPQPVTRNAVLVMTETPAPVSSTPAPVHLTRRLEAVHARPRLSDLSEPSGGSRASLFAVVAVALLVGAGGGAAYWMKKVPPPRAAVAHEGPMVAASATTSSAVEATPSPPHTGGALPLGSAEMALPPSELIQVASASPSASAPPKRGKGTRHTKEGAPEPQGTEPPPPFAEDLGPARAAPATPAATVAKARFSNVHATNVDPGKVGGALPMGAFGRCYQGASGSHSMVTVHLELTPARTKANTSISDDGQRGLAACVNGIAENMKVAGVPETGATADVQLDFDAP
jgi:serine/threonine-protein kinase